MRIIDDFLPASYANTISSCLNSPGHQWSFNPRTVGKSEETELLQYGFSYNICGETGFNTTDITKLIIPMTYFVQDEIGGPNNRLERCRLDMTVANGVKVRHQPHQDLEHEHTTAIYYVSDSDGDTLVYNEKEPSDEYTIMESITPKKNRLIIFDGLHFHTGHSPMEHPSRILVNMNFS